MTVAKELKSKYDKINGKTTKYKSTLRKTKYTKRVIYFKNNDNITVILTDPQERGLRNSGVWSKIKMISGKGYVTRK